MEEVCSDLAVAQKLAHVPWCEEYERMISGQSFDPSSSVHLCKTHRHVLAFCNSYNNGPVPSHLSAQTVRNRRRYGLKTVLGKVGDGANIEKPFRCQLGCNVMVGAGVSAEAGLAIFDFAIVTISDRVTIGRNVTLMTAGDRLDGCQYARPIFIEEDCEIGANVLVLPGIRIGKRCKIAPGTIVAKDMPEDSLVAGKPARVVGSSKGDGEVLHCN